MEKTYEVIKLLSLSPVVRDRFNSIQLSLENNCYELVWFLKDDSEELIRAFIGELALEVGNFEIVEELKLDPHPLVRNWIKEVEEDLSLNHVLNEVE